MSLEEFLATDPGYRELLPPKWPLPMSSDTFVAGLERLQAEPPIDGLTLRVDVRPSSDKPILDCCLLQTKLSYLEMADVLRPLASPYLMDARCDPASEDAAAREHRYEAGWHVFRKDRSHYPKPAPEDLEHITRALDGADTRRFDTPKMFIGPVIPAQTFLTGNTDPTSLARVRWPVQIFFEQAVAGIRGLEQAPGARYVGIELCSPPNPKLDQRLRWYRGDALIVLGDLTAEDIMPWLEPLGLPGFEPPPQAERPEWIRPWGLPGPKGRVFEVPRECIDPFLIGAEQVHPSDRAYAIWIGDNNFPWPMRYNETMSGEIEGGPLDLSSMKLDLPRFK